VKAPPIFSNPIPSLSSNPVHPQGPYWPIALTQNTAGAKMATNIDSYTPSITTTLSIFWMQVSCTKLQFNAKSR